jgi:alpha-N-arabinofuranosidase
VVNRHKDKTITSDIISNSGTFTGEAETQLLNIASLEEPFTFDKQEQYKPVKKEISVKGNKISCSFPAHSFTQIKVGVKK